MMTNPTSKSSGNVRQRALFFVISLVALPAAFSLNAAEQEDDQSDWYLSAAIGHVSGSRSAGEISKDLTSSGVVVTNIDIDDSRIGWRFNLGYDLTDSFAIEVGYTDLNEVTVALTVETTAPESFISDASKIHPESAYGVTFGGVYRYTLLPDFDLTGSLGLMRWESDYNTTSFGENKNVGSDSQSGVDVYYGVGGNYQLTDDVDLLLGWERYRIDSEDIDMWTGGINYHF